jgi:hypothetical protein
MTVCIHAVAPTQARKPKSRARFLVGALVVAVIVLPTAASAGSPPPGATARCRDSTYSYSKHHSGTCSHHGGVAAWLDGSSSSTGGAASSSSVTGTAVPVSLGHIVLLGRHTKTSGCRRGAEPDRRCSPGAYYSGLTKAVLCSPSFRTSSIRNVPDSEKFAVEQEYGMAARRYGRSIEIDHIVSLELGGANVPENLFPEPGNGAANFHVKDRLENRVAAMVCDGDIGLRAAQRQIATAWEALYRRVFGTPPTG